MNLKFSWWNTSLSPLCIDRATDAQRAFALEVVTCLTSGIGVDLLALGEVALADIEWLMEKANLDDYDFYDGTEKDGRLQFDTGVLFRKDSMDFVKGKPLIVRKSSRKMKLANQIEFSIPGTDMPFFVFVSHWPSRRNHQKDGPDRNLLGIRLRDHIDELYDNCDGPVHTILLGDFNDEPFDITLSDHLPFWRLLGEGEPHVPDKPCQSNSGSYFHKTGEHTQWRTFDQIIFSSTFLGNSEWHLNEKYSQILKFQQFDPTISNYDKIFDHFPVISVIEREEPND